MQKKNKYLLEIEDLSVKFNMYKGKAYAVRNFNLCIAKNETFALVGESGSGKSVTAKSILKLHPKDKTEINGKILFNNENLIEKDDKYMQRIRGNSISMIFQDPMISLNPLIKVGEQISETIRYHRKKEKKAAKLEAIKLIDQVGIPYAEERYDQYPHEFSGGMLQRLMIAIALSCRPEFLIADEPTTALDVTVQVQILKLMRQLQYEMGMSILLITHNLGVVAEICDKVAVMYAGRLVEISNIKDIFNKPLHPYTKGLLEAIPVIGQKNKKLKNIEGNPPNIFNTIKGCSFSPRCEYKTDICLKQEPELIEKCQERYVACHNVEKNI